MHMIVGKENSSHSFFFSLCHDYCFQKEEIDPQGVSVSCANGWTKLNSQFRPQLAGKLPRFSHL